MAPLCTHPELYPAQTEMGVLTACVRGRPTLELHAHPPSFCLGVVPRGNLLLANEECTWLQPIT